MEQKPSIGRIVEFFPGQKEISGIALPNGMESAPAIITQVFGSCVNLTVFVCDPTRPDSCRTAWSVFNINDCPEGEAGWDWPKKV